MGAADKFATIIACHSEIMGRKGKDSSLQNPEVSKIVSQAGEFLRKCKSRGRSSKTGRPTRGLSSAGFGFVLLCREMADAMANLYLESFESAYFCVQGEGLMIITGRDMQVSDTSYPYFLVRIPKILGQPQWCCTQPAPRGF